MRIAARHEMAHNWRPSSSVRLLPLGYATVEISSLPFGPGSNEHAIAETACLTLKGLKEAGRAMRPMDSCTRTVLAGVAILVFSTRK